MPTKTLHFPELAKRVRSQRKALPSLYGDVDFSAQPYRLALDPDDTSSLPGWAADRAALLADDRTVELMRTATMLGDVVADAYAALMEQQSFKSLIDMLQRACREGIDAVPDAPPELERFIAAMKRSSSGGAPGTASIPSRQAVWSISIRLLKLCCSISAA